MRQRIDDLVDEILTAAFGSREQAAAIGKLEDAIRKLYPLTGEEYLRM